ncbi:MAG: UDP-N-acetylglucosamine 1-carboxyvinyltransferase [Clostridiaceae bacterium]|nr:UDP-N-acetylglucosamine 1-carboxyvinyltransferase [Clostridiaceae bacterium]
MGAFVIHGGKPLMGSALISSSKNAILPILSACLLTEEECVIKQIPGLDDVSDMCELISNLGANVKVNGRSRKITVAARSLTGHTAGYELVSRLRASFLVTGPLLARVGMAKVALPGGCPIGSRPVNLHLKGFEAMGAIIENGHGFIDARCPDKKLHGATIYLDFPSVGATENLLTAAVLAEGRTVIENAASEPEIVDLASFLTKMGAKISGAGTDTITIDGVDKVYGAEHTIMPDRIEAGTFMVAAALTGGDITLKNVVPEHLKPVTAKLRESGMEIIEGDDTIRVKGVRRPLPLDIKTHPFPGFPTDMQAQLSAYTCFAEGTSVIVETIFENRFMHVNELRRMGAQIRVDGRTAIIEGMETLQGAQVRATDLRAGAALVIAGLAATGTTEVLDIHHIDRGYEFIENKLQRLGADIRRIS